MSEGESTSWLLLGGKHVNPLFILVNGNPYPGLGKWKMLKLLKRDTEFYTDRGGDRQDRSARRDDARPAIRRARPRARRAAPRARGRRARLRAYTLTVRSI